MMVHPYLPMNNRTSSPIFSPHVLNDSNLQSLLPLATRVATGTSLSSCSRTPIHWSSSFIRHPDTANLEASLSAYQHASTHLLIKAYISAWSHNPYSAPRTNTPRTAEARDGRFTMQKIMTDESSLTKPLHARRTRNQ